MSMKKGGYKIIDLQNQDLDYIYANDGFIEGLYESIENNYQKVMLVTGIVIGNVEKPDIFVEVKVIEDYFIINIYNYELIIYDDNTVETNIITHYIPQDIKNYIERNPVITFNTSTRKFDEDYDYHTLLDLFIKYKVQLQYYIPCISIRFIRESYLSVAYINISGDVTLNGNKNIVFITNNGQNYNVIFSNHYINDRFYNDWDIDLNKTGVYIEKKVLNGNLYNKNSIDLFVHTLTLTCNSSIYYYETISTKNLVVDSIQDLNTLLHATNGTIIPLGTTKLTFNGSTWNDGTNNLTAVSDSVKTHY